MTRRIALALVLLTAAVLIAAVVPLALGAIAHERDAFVQDTVRTANSIASLAREPLENHGDGPALSDAMADAERNGDEVLVENRYGQRVAKLSHGAPVNDAWRELAAEAAGQHSSTSELTKDAVIAVETIWGGTDSGTQIGTVILERPTGPLNQNIANLWLYLCALGGGALVAAVLVAIYLARWVSRPLARLDAAAGKIADGDLTVRARPGHGPPELRRMAATFNMMAGRLETLVHGHRVMLADASHQLRTPLTALRLRLDLLATDASPATAAELAGAQEEIARLSRLVDGLLATARAEALTEQLETIDVTEAVAERVSAWQPVADGHDVKLVAEVSSDSGKDSVGRRPMVALGAGHLEQILDNLIDNAIGAIGGSSGGAVGGIVRISTANGESGPLLTVADDGPGMTAQERSRAFLRYTTGSQNGTGLGLAIVHRLVTANGGAIRLADTPGGGLTVEIEFLSPTEP
ncbi:MAG: HAMP domain-containing sensor histidine kinase [Trebonia sp.]|jgi:signal transduction histidine kinase